MRSPTFSLPLRAAGPPGDQFANLAEVVVGLERRADAGEREVHHHVEALQFLVSHVVRVRIINMRERIEIDLQHGVGAEFFHRLRLPL